MSGGRELPDWLGAYVEYVKTHEPPELYKMWVGVSAICAALQRKCYTMWETEIFPNMFIVLVGPPACRKGTSLRPAKSFLKALGIKLASQSITREALIQELEEAQNMEPVEGEGVTIEIHSSLTIFSEELTVFLGQNNWQLISDLNNWFDCENPWTYRTKGQGTNEVNGVWVNLIGATTPEFLQSALPSDAIGGGLSSRIVFVFGDRKSCLNARPFKTNEERVLEPKLLNDLGKIHMLKGEFRLTEEYLALYDPWYNENDKKPPFKDPSLLAYNERRALHLRKLSMVMSASRTDSMLIEAEDFIRAQRLLTRTEEFMKFVFMGRGRAEGHVIFTQIARDLVEEGQLTKQTILERYHADITESECDRMMKTLVSMGRATLSERHDTRTNMTMVTLKHKSDRPNESAEERGIG